MASHFWLNPWSFSLNDPVGCPTVYSFPALWTTEKARSRRVPSVCSASCRAITRHHGEGVDCMGIVGDGHARVSHGHRRRQIRFMLMITDWPHVPTLSLFSFPLVGRSGTAPINPSPASWSYISLSWFYVLYLTQLLIGGFS